MGIDLKMLRDKGFIVGAAFSLFAITAMNVCALDLGPINPNVAKALDKYARSNHPEWAAGESLVIKKPNGKREGVISIKAAYPDNEGNACFDYQVIEKGRVNPIKHTMCRPTGPNMGGALDVLKLK